MATHSSILAWEIPWTEKPGRLQSMGSQRVGHNWVTEHANHKLFLTWASIHLWSKKPCPRHGCYQQMVCHPRLPVAAETRTNQKLVGSLAVERIDSWGRTTKRFEQSQPKHAKSKIWNQKSRKKSVTGSQPWEPTGLKAKDSFSHRE